MIFYFKTTHLTFLQPILKIDFKKVFFYHSFKDEGDTLTVF